MEHPPRLLLVSVCLRCTLPGCAALLAGCAPATPEWLPCEDALGAIAFSELMPDPPGADGGREWLELANVDPHRDLTLRGAVLAYAKAPDEPHARHLIEDLVVPRASFAILASSSDAVVPAPGDAPVVATYGSGLGDLSNSSGHLQLLCGTTILDEFTYRDPLQGAARALDGRRSPTPEVNDDPGHWCDARAPLPDGSFGTPGAANEPCEPPATLACGDAASTASLVAPAPGDIVVSELMLDPDAVDDRNGEWIELLVRKDIDLTGLELGHFESGLPVVDHVVEFEDCAHAAAGTYILLATNIDPAQNGGVHPVAAHVPLALSNAAGSMFVGIEGVVLDAVEWSESPAGASIGRVLVPDDPAAPPGPMCPSTTPYGSGDRGSPGAPNPPCLTASQDAMCRTDDGLWRPTIVPVPGDVTVTELLPNPDALPDVSGEWFELHAHRDLDLNGLDLVRDGTLAATLDQEDCLSVGAGDYVVVARREAAAGPGLPSSTIAATFSLPNAGGSLEVRVGDLLLDAVSWSAAPSGASLNLDPDAFDPTANDASDAWCVSTLTFASGDYGSPGVPNTPCAPPPSDAVPVESAGEEPENVTPETCVDPQGVRDLRVPTPGALVVSEIMPNPAAVADEHGEWLELLALAPVDLNGLVVARDEDRGAPLRDDTCLALEPGDRAVLVRHTAPDENGGIERGLRLEVSLVQSQGTLQLFHEDVLLDEVAWSESPPGVAWALAPEGENPQSNDDPQHWCAATATYGDGDRGTPGLENRACSSALTCIDGQTPRAIVFPRPGELRISEWMASPDAVPDRQGEWFELHARAEFDMNGLLVGRTYPADDMDLWAPETCVTVHAGDLLVFARSTSVDENGGIPDVFATFDFTLADSDGGLFIATPSELLDEVAWSRSTAGAATVRTDDDVECAARTPLGSGDDLGTPGAANDTCP